MPAKDPIIRVRHCSAGIACLILLSTLAGGAAAQSAGGFPEGLDPMLRDRVGDLAGASLHWIEGGPPSGPAVVLLHGARYDATIWNDVGTLERLAAMGFRAIAVDLPGFGRSESVSLGPERILSGILETLGLTRPVVVAPSMAGLFALPYAIENRDGLAGLVVVAPAGIRQMGDGFRRIRAPTLLIWGEHDSIVPRILAETMEREIRNARLTVLPNAGHACYIDDPDGFHRELLAFLATVK